MLKDPTGILTIVAIASMIGFGFEMGRIAARDFCDLQIRVLRWLLEPKHQTKLAAQPTVFRANGAVERI